MFLVRLTVLIALVALILPRDPASTERLSAQYTAVKEWALSSCDRNTEACHTAAGVWRHVKINAQHTAGLMIGAIRTTFAGSSVRETSGSANPSNTLFKRPKEPIWPFGSSSAEQGTLTAKDLEPEWRGQVR